MKIQYVGTIPEKAHVLHVGLLCDDGVLREVPVRKSRYESLTAAQRLAYATQCAEYHHPSGRDGDAKRSARRARWDVDDKAAAKAAEEAKFIMRHVATTDAGVTVSVTWRGLTAQHVIPNDPANAQANAQAAHQAVLDAKAAEALAQAAFNVG